MKRVCVDCGSNFPETVDVCPCGSNSFIMVGWPMGQIASGYYAFSGPYAASGHVGSGTVIAPLPDNRDGCVTDTPKPVPKSNPFIHGDWRK